MHDEMNGGEGNSKDPASHQRVYTVHVYKQSNTGRFPVEYTYT